MGEVIDFKKYSKHTTSGSEQLVQGEQNNDAIRELLAHKYSREAKYYTKHAIFTGIVALSGAASTIFLNSSDKPIASTIAIVGFSAAAGISSVKNGFEAGRSTEAAHQNSTHFVQHDLR